MDKCIKPARTDILFVTQSSYKFVVYDTSSCIFPRHRPEKTASALRNFLLNIPALTVPSTVNVVSLPRNVLRVTTQQPSNKIANFERCTSPLNLAFPVHLTATCSSRLILHGSIDNSRADAVDSNLPIANFFRRRPAQANHGMLRGCVCRILGEPWYKR